MLSLGKRIMARIMAAHVVSRKLVGVRSVRRMVEFYVLIEAVK